MQDRADVAPSECPCSGAAKILAAQPLMLAQTISLGHFPTFSKTANALVLISG